MAGGVIGDSDMTLFVVISWSLEDILRTSPGLIKSSSASLDHNSASSAGRGKPRDVPKVSPEDHTFCSRSWVSETVLPAQCVAGLLTVWR